MDKTEARIRFSISSNEIIDNGEITNIIGHEPTLTYNKGDYIRKNLYRKENLWEYSIGYKETVFVDELLEEIYKILNPNLPKLSEYTKFNHLSVKFHIGIHIYDEQTPGMVFTHDFIKLCYELNADIDTDMYVY